MQYVEPRVRLRSPFKAALFFLATFILVFTAWLTETGRWALQDDARYVSYFAAALIAARLRVSSKLNGERTSMIFTFVLLALVELNLLETLLIAGCAIMLDTLSRRLDDRRLEDALHGLLSMGCGATAAQAVYHSHLGIATHIEWPVRLVVASLVCFLASNLPLLALAALDQPRTRASLKRSLYLFSFPYYLLAGTITALFAALHPWVDWYAAAALVPVFYLLYCSYRAYLGRIETQRLRATGTTSLHLRTLETLAAAIDRGSQSEYHLQRVQHYAVEIGRELQMAERDLDALRAGAILHDVGNLGVPEHIISKAGTLTLEEYERIKIHPIVGAKIVESVSFPYPVAPIVRHHHERWDGSGYPSGLKGNQIPLGARILAVVDCFDALVSDRRYRAAMPADAAIAYLTDRSGTLYDPTVTEVLKKRYRELESELVRVTGGRSAPASLGAAREEMGEWLELQAGLAKALTFDEISLALGDLLRPLVLYDALTITPGGQAPAKPDLVCGDYTAIRRHRSKASVPLVGESGPAGILTVYRIRTGGFSQEQSRLLNRASGWIGNAAERARRYVETEQSATTDFLTGLPNAKALFDQLERTFANTSTNGEGATVMVCDLNGFKKINDTFGHMAGNRVLQEVGQALKRNTREYDYVARLGGDEFVLIMPALPETLVDERLANLRAVVREAGRKASGSDILGASFGAARFPADGATADQVLAVADRRMYEEKGQRKNATSLLELPLHSGPLSAETDPL